MIMIKIKNKISAIRKMKDTLWFVHEREKFDQKRVNFQRKKMFLKSFGQKKHFFLPQTEMK